MKVEKLLKMGCGEVTTIKPNATVMEGAQLLAAHKIGLLVVSDGNGRLSGVFSERDLVRVVGLHGKLALDRTIDTAMTADVQVCNPTEDVQDVMSSMAKGRFRHMPVLKHGVLCGMVSTTDILKYLADDVAADERALFWSKIAWV